MRLYPQHNSQGPVRGAFLLAFPPNSPLVDRIAPNFFRTQCGRDLGLLLSPLTECTPPCGSAHRYQGSTFRFRRQRPQVGKGRMVAAVEDEITPVKARTFARVGDTIHRHDAGGGRDRGGLHRPALHQPRDRGGGDAGAVRGGLGIVYGPAVLHVQDERPDLKGFSGAFSDTYRKSVNGKSVQE